MECLTDNLNRSASEVRAAVQKAGGKMADPGSVMFNFQRQGQVFVSSEASEDQVIDHRLVLVQFSLQTCFCLVLLSKLLCWPGTYVDFWLSCTVARIHQHVVY